MSEWRETTLGEFVSLQRGHDLTEPERKPGIVPIMGSAGQNGYHNTALAKGPGIVIGRSGASFGQVHYCLGDYWPHNTALYVTNFHSNDPLFAYYLLKSIDFTRYNSGSAQPSLNRNYIYHIPISVPKPGTQRTIGRILGDLDDKIELNRQINQTLEQIAQTLFKSWFVDFEPVKAKIAAKAAGRDPERAAMCAISGKFESELDQLPPEHRQQLAATAALFPDELVESELGLIPLGWEVGTLADLCVLNAKSWGAKTIPAQVHYVDLANTKNGEISDVQIFSAEDAPSRARRVLRSGDTIIGTVRPGNRSFALIGSSGPVLTGSTGFAVLSPKTEKLRELVFMLAISDLNIDRLTRLADGAAYPAVRPEVVVEEQCIISPDGLVEKFHLVVGPLFDQILANRESFVTLATLRDTLLPKLLSGELTVERQTE